MRNFQDEVPKHYLETVRQQIKRVAEDGDDRILQQIDAEEAAEIELERTTVPEEAILEPYSEVEDVAENVLIELFTFIRC